MADRSRKVTAWSVSALVHALAVGFGGLQLVPQIEMPEIEFELTEIEFVDPAQLQGAEPEAATPETPVAVPMPPTPPSESTAEPTPEVGPEPKPEPPKPKPFARRRSKVDKLGPSNSTFFILLANRKIRKLGFRDKAVDIMAPLPDFRFLIQGGGFDTLHDFNYLVIASPDLRDVTQTFLAVDYSVTTDELKAGVERAAAATAQHVEWETRGDALLGNPVPTDPEAEDPDPRWFVLRDNTAIYLREEFLPFLDADGDAKTSGNFVGHLSKLRRFARREPRAAMQLVMKDLRSALKRVRGLPFEVPDDIEVMTEAADEPELSIRLGFLEVAHAKQAEAFWKSDVRALLNKYWYLGIGWIYEQLKISRRGDTLTLKGRFTAEQADLLLGLLADQSRKMMRRSPKQMAKAKAERERIWQARNGGKLPPSGAFPEPAGSSGTGGDPGSGDGSARPQPELPDVVPDPAPPAGEVSPRAPAAPQAPSSRGDGSAPPADPTPQPG